MIRPILFLDIDGVLNSMNYAETQYLAGNRSSTWGIDPAAVEHLNEIVERSNCQIVISSSWRVLHTMVEIKEYLHKAGFAHVNDVIDYTPQMSSRIRGEEVKKWIDDNSFEGAYCILDDNADFFPNQPLVRTFTRVGLCHYHIDICVERLLHGTRIKYI